MILKEIALILVITNFLLTLKYDSIESKELLEKAVGWVTEFNKKFDKREFRPIVMNTEGKSVLVTRYFRAIKPPEELIEKDATSFETAVTINFIFLESD